VFFGVALGLLAQRFLRDEDRSFFFRRQARVLQTVSPE